MLLFLHGRSDSPFDMTRRPFLLRFNTDDRAERLAAFRELATDIAIDPQPYLTRPGDTVPG